MDQTVWLNLFCYILAATLFVAARRDYVTYRDTINMEIQRKKYECMDYGKSLRIGNSVVALLSLAFIFIGYAMKDNNMACTAVVMTGLFAASVMRAQMNSKLYYNDEYFWLGTDRIAFSSVKGFGPRTKVPFQSRKVYTLNGKEYRTSEKAVALIQQKMEERKEKKASRKK